jgi:hypothetical protein
MVTREELRAASRRADRKRAARPIAVAARYDGRAGRVVVRLSNDVEVSFPPSATEGLEHAKPAQLSTIEISPSGLGLHWPKLDADLFVPGLLEGALGSRRWMAARLGKQGGQARSEAKSAASRNNGKLGGRPRRSAAG